MRLYVKFRLDNEVWFVNPDEFLSEDEAMCRAAEMALGKCASRLGGRQWS